MAAVNTRDTALGYIRRGWSPIPVPHGRKIPVLKGWQKLRVTEENLDAYFGANGHEQNVGILTGEPSGGLNDADLDCSEALRLADDFLPKTGSEFGRKSNPRSHRQYRAGLPSKLTFTDPIRKDEGRDDDKGRLLEVLATGQQVVAPGSTHESGEAIEWAKDGEPAEVEVAELVTAASRLAAAAILCRYWPKKGARHDAALALAGGLLSAGWSKKDAEHFVGAVARAAGDDEVEDRIAAVGTTEARIRGGGTATGWTTLGKLIDARTVKAARGWLGATSGWEVGTGRSGTTVAGGRPQILATERPLDCIAADALQALARANDPAVLFVRTGSLVRVVQDEQGRSTIDPIGMGSLTWRLAQVAEYTAPGRDGPRQVPPPERLVQVLLARGEWPFPALEAVTECPVLRPDGSVLATPGYDAATRLIYAPAAGLEVPPIPAAPTDDDVGAAMVRIELLLADFPFARDVSPEGEDLGQPSCANAVAALLTPILRPAIPGQVPIAVFDKPQAGTGASLLAEVIATIATGRPAAMMTAPETEEEWRKNITSVLLGGATVILIDNVDRRLASGKLAAAVTAPAWQDRILGRNEIVTLPQRATWIVTGNNIALGGDLPRRCFYVRLDAKQARPWERTGFRYPDLVGHVQERRGELLGDLLTIAAGWFAAGRPAATVPTVGGFGGWSRIVGGVLAYAGVPDFLGNLPRFYERADNESSQWAAFLPELAIRFPQGLTSATLAEALRQEVRLRELMPDAIASAFHGDPAGAQRQLGHALAKQDGVRFFGGWHLARGGREHGAVLWLVMGGPGS